MESRARKGVLEAEVVTDDEEVENMLERGSEEMRWEMAVKSLVS